MGFSRDAVRKFVLFLAAEVRMLPAWLCMGPLRRSNKASVKSHRQSFYGLLHLWSQTPLLQALQ